MEKRPSADESAKAQKVDGVRFGPIWVPIDTQRFGWHTHPAKPANPWWSCIPRTDASKPGLEPFHDPSILACTPPIDPFSVPVEIVKLSALKELDLSENRMIYLPPEIGQLSALEELYLWDNRLESLPKEIGQLARLRVLRVDMNDLTSIPTQIGLLSKLEVLQVSNNKLTSVPVEIGRLKKLEVLLLHGNQLPSIPLEVLKSEKLYNVTVEENKFSKAVSLRTEKCNATVEDIRTLLLQQISWSEHYHQFYPKKVKEAIFTVTMISSKRSCSQSHPESKFYRLPKEILYTIFHFYAASIVNKLSVWEGIERLREREPRLKRGKNGQGQISSPLY